MPTYANIIPKAPLDGLLYASSVSLSGTEVDLYNQTNADPPPLIYNAAIVASVEMALSGSPASNTAYVVLQTDMGDGMWYDAAWGISTITTGNANFLLSAGVGGANSLQQTRAAGTAPSSNGSNQFPLGGRIRFVGKAAL